MTSALAIVAGLVLLSALGYLLMYNALVSARQATVDSWAAIDVELERRHTLIPQLVATVKQSAAHERELLEALVRADQVAAAVDHTAGARSQPEAIVAEAARAVVALRERYPELDTQRDFLRLQQELAITEDRIGAARRFHNTRVAKLNQLVEAIPTTFVAMRHNIERADYFQR